jgi:trehalose 6-phosphate synthase/phosphatase
MRVNHAFANQIAQLLEQSDLEGREYKETLIWIHDYHLLLLPQLIREMFPSMVSKKLKIGLFLHIPFPAPDVFRTVPQREQLLTGMIHADLVGFQAFGYMRNFLSSAELVLGCDTSSAAVHSAAGTCHVGVHPVGIEPQMFIDTLVQNADCASWLAEYKTALKGKKVIVAVDRADYIKALPLKFCAYEAFLERNPDLAKEVVMVQVAVPSRDDVPEYQQHRKQVYEIVARIAGRFGTAAHNPLVFMHCSVTLPQLTALYHIGDVCWVSSIRDGMNLVSFEYIATQQHNQHWGVLLLSEFAAASRCLAGAVLVNPWDVSGSAAALRKALLMPAAEREARGAQLHQYVMKQTSFTWVKDFLEDLSKQACPSTDSLPLPLVDADTLPTITRHAALAAYRLLFLDFDGTLVPIQEKAASVKVTPSAVRALSACTNLPETTVYVVSGRSKDYLASQFDAIPQVGLIAEHGAFRRQPGSEVWECTASEIGTKAVVEGWKEPVMALMDYFVARTPGAWVEKKEFSVCFHYRSADEEFGEFQAKNVLSLLRSMHDLPVDILAQKKCIDVRLRGVDKGTAVERVWRESAASNSFVLCAGDDATDEDMFRAVNAFDGCTSVTVRVGDVSKERATKAKYSVQGPKDLVSVLAAVGGATASVTPVSVPVHSRKLSFADYVEVVDDHCSVFDDEYDCVTSANSSQFSVNISAQGRIPSSASYMLLSTLQRTNVSIDASATLKKSSSYPNALCTPSIEASEMRPFDYH